MNTNEEEWKWQMQNRISSVEQLKDAIGLTDDEAQSMAKVAEVFPIQITPYYASLIEKGNPNDPLRLQIVPDEREYEEMISKAENDGKKIDELKEELACEGRIGGWDNPEEFIDNEHVVEQKYPNRVAWLITNLCPAWCRHCVRKVMSEDSITQPFSRERLESAIQAIEAKEDVNDVLVTGGDAFMVPTEVIDEVLTRLLEIDHIHTVRFGTRTPVTLPQRITSDIELVDILSKHMKIAKDKDKDIIINTHFNHPNEITEESRAALRLLRQTGCRLQNQTVLLRGVNDKIEILEELFHGIYRLGVRPYYLYQGIPTPGANFRYSTISKGLSLMKEMYERQNLSGHEKPRYIFADSKYGKIVLPPPGVEYKITQEVDEAGVLYERFQFPWKDGEVDCKIIV